jgi:tetratricopeptide (TPR) repeat protein
MLFHEPHENLYFDQSARLMLRLHELMVAGKDESEDGQQVRDEMDYPWYQLSQEEQDVIGGLSADLYTIGEDQRSPSADDVSSAVVQEVTDLYDRKNWSGLLDFMREKQASLPRADVAYYRGICWQHLRQPAIFAEFLTEAVRLAPNNRAFDALRMHALVQSEQLDRALERAREIAESEGDWRQLLTAGGVFFMAARESDAAGSRNFYELAIQLAERGIALAPKLEEAGGDPTDLARTACLRAHLDRIWSYEQIGQTEKAIEACNDALQIEHENSFALIMRGWLQLPAQQEGASNDFHAGIEQQISARPELEIPVATFPVSASS